MAVLLALLCRPAVLIYSPSTVAKPLTRVLHTPMRAGKISGPRPSCIVFRWQAVSRRCRSLRCICNGIIIYWYLSDTQSFQVHFVQLAGGVKAVQVQEVTRS